MNYLSFASAQLLWEYLDFSLFTLHFSLQQLTWYRLNYLTTDYLTTSEI